MADIASSDVTYTQVAGSAKASPGDPRFSAIYTVAFGNDSLNYPSGGVPLLKGKLGCPTQIDEVTILDSGSSALNVKFDLANLKVRLFNPTGAHTHDFKVIGAQAAASTDAISAKTLTLGKEAATDITIAGANSATLGGVVSAAASAGAELGNVAVAALTLKIKVVGY